MSVTTTKAKGIKAAYSSDTDAGRDKSLNLYERILAVMCEVRGLQKDKVVSGGSFSYKAMSEYKVVSTIRVAMVRYGLVLFPINQKHRLSDLHRENGKIVSLTTIDVQYKIVNVDKPSEYELLASSGTGVDSQDKGVGKAMTYALKYALMRTFLIPTGDDPDDIHNNDLDHEQTARAAAVEAVNYPGEFTSYVAPEQLTYIKSLLEQEGISADIRNKTLLALPTMDAEKAERLVLKLHTVLDAHKLTLSPSMP